MLYRPGIYVEPQRRKSFDASAPLCLCVCVCLSNSKPSDYHTVWSALHGLWDSTSSVTLFWESERQTTYDDIHSDKYSSIPHPFRLLAKFNKLHSSRISIQHTRLFVHRPNDHYLLLHKLHSYIATKTKTSIIGMVLKQLGSITRY